MDNKIELSLKSFKHKEHFNNFYTEEIPDIASNGHPVDILMESFTSWLHTTESYLTETFDISEEDSVLDMDFYIEDDYLQDYNSTDHDPWSIHNLNVSLSEFQPLAQESECVKSLPMLASSKASIRKSFRKKHYSTSDIPEERFFVTSCTQTETDNADCDSFFEGSFFSHHDAELQIAFDCSLSDDSIYIVDTSISHWCLSEDITNEATPGVINPHQYTEHKFLLCRENQHLLSNSSACSTYSDTAVHSVECADSVVQQHKYCDKWKTMWNSGFTVWLNLSFCHNFDIMPLTKNMNGYQEECFTATKPFENIKVSGATSSKLIDTDYIQSCGIHCTSAMLQTSLRFTMNRKHHRKKPVCESFSVGDPSLDLFAWGNESCLHGILE